MKLKWSVFYVVSIVMVNIAFTIFPPVMLNKDLAWPPASIAVGLLFVLRDYAQKEIGHKVILAMLLAAAISYFMASPFVAIASVAAFLVSEFCDWAIYSFSKRSFRDRVLLSSAISTPIDSIVFLHLIGHLSVTAVVLMTLSKMLAALFIWKHLPE